MTRIFSTFLMGAALLLVPVGANAAQGSLEEVKAVQLVQQILADGGFYRGPVDGEWDADTRNSVRGFQAANGLPATGFIDDRTAMEMGINEIASAQIPDEEATMRYEREMAMKRDHDNVRYETRYEVRADNTDRYTEITPASGNSEDRIFPTMEKRELGPVTRAEIQAAQQALRDAGYYRANVDGVIGVKTREALRSFQNDNELAQTGKLDIPTREKLSLVVPDAKITRHAEERPQ